MTRASAARRAAYDVLVQVRTRDAFVREVLPGVLAAYDLGASDRAFATRLAIGCVQMQGSLDEVLDRAMRSPRDAKPKVRDALRVSTYEMLFLGREPYAAVDQGVELAAWVAPRARGLANAVLRKVVTLADEFPFGDPSTDIAAAARLHGFPLWLAQRFEVWLGSAEARRFMEVSNEQPPVFASVNALRATDQEVHGKLESVRIGFSWISAVLGAGTEGLRSEAAQPSLRPPDPARDESVVLDGFTIRGCLKLDDPADVANPVFRELIASGDVIVADAAAQTVAATVAEQASASVLDACAGRGTKAILIQSDAQRLRGAQVERFTAMDNVASKRLPFEEHAKACGVHISAYLVGDATDLSATLGDEAFDAVLIDAPCTGLGTLRRHPEIRWRITPDELEAAAKLDDRLLASAAAQVAPGGTLIYATCTIAPGENEGAIERFLSTPAGAAFSVEPIAGAPFFAPSLTSGGCDAHFCAVMRKRA